MSIELLIGLIVAVLAAFALLVGRRLRLRALSTPDMRAAARALHLAGQAGPPLRGGLTPESAAKSLPSLRALLATPGVALCRSDGAVLASVGPADHHVTALAEHVTQACATGRREVLRLPPCPQAGCQAERALILPLVVAGNSTGALIVLTTGAIGPYLVTAADESARFITAQLELAGLDVSRDALARAEVRALRAQISPHFVYNSLTTIAAFVRSDPHRARELLLEFADFTRYSFRTAGEYTTLADELGNIDRYLILEKARFGDRLKVKLQIAPEVLAVVVPFLSVQPLVENAVRHGLAGQAGGGTVTIVAADLGADCVISVEDDGIGMEPKLVGRTAPDENAGAHVGLGNVDDRLRAAFGQDYGLVVETAPQAGTKVILRVPKYAPGVAVDKPAVAQTDRGRGESK